MRESALGVDWMGRCEVEQRRRGLLLELVLRGNWRGCKVLEDWRLHSQERERVSTWEIDVLQKIRWRRDW